MAVIMQAQFASAVTDANEDIFTKSYIENGISILEFDTRKRNFKKIIDLKSNNKIKWNSDIYTVDVKEFSTFHNPVAYRFIVCRGSYYNSTGERIFFTPKIDEVSMNQHVSKCIVRLSCYLAVNCGVTLENISTIFTTLFLVSITKSSVKRWIDEIGDNLPSDEGILKKLIEIKAPKECHIDGYYPMGTSKCVMVIKDEYDRILITHETDSESKIEAMKFLQKIKDLGVDVKSAFSDYSKSFTESIREVFPDVKFQADHFHTVKNIWKHFKKAYLEFRRSVKSKAEKYKQKKRQDDYLDLAKKLWDMRWIFLKKPCNLSCEEKKQIKELQDLDRGGFVKEFRSILKSIVSIFDKSETEYSAKAKLERLRNRPDIASNKHYARIIKFFDDHWDEAMQYLKIDGTRKRASNSESGMRLLRRLEKNHDGIRSERSRKNYIKIYQTINYLVDKDIADFISNSGPDG